jgi:hypothetical protein
MLYPQPYMNRNQLQKQLFRKCVVGHSLSLHVLYQKSKIEARFAKIDQKLNKELKNTNPANTKNA